MRSAIACFAACFAAYCSGDHCPNNPITIDMTRSTFRPAPVSEAAWMWNNALGREAMVLGDAGGVVIYKVYSLNITGCEGATACAIADVSLDGVIRSCEIYALPSATARVLAHELGHCAGLPHDEIPGSIMQTGTAWDDEILQEHIDHFEACAGSDS